MRLSARCKEQRPRRDAQVMSATAMAALRALWKLLLLIICLWGRLALSSGRSPVAWPRADGKRAYVLPLDRAIGVAPPRALLRNGTLPIHGAVREGCAARKRALSAACDAARQYAAAIC